MSQYDYRGVIQCRSKYSDGAGSIEEIAAAANTAGLDFLITTDLNSLKAKDEGQEKYQGSTLLICGAELAGANPYLVFGAEPFKGAEKLKDKPAQEMIDEVAKHKWLGFISNPEAQASQRFGLPSRAWTDWNVQNFTGMSIWNLLTDWLTQFDRDTVTMDDYNEFQGILSGPRMETVKRWDELCQKRKVVGIGTVDNRAFKGDFKGEAIEIFPYETAFAAVSNHILLDQPLEKDFKKARKQVLDAITAGRVYVSFDGFDDPTDFVFEIDTGKGTGRMGDEIKLGEKNELVVALPDAALINVFHNGESIHEDENDEVLIDISEPGVYRIEAMRDNLTWILSNPIWVTK